MSQILKYLYKLAIYFKQDAKKDKNKQCNSRIFKLTHNKNGSVKSCVNTSVVLNVN
jgi:hypothetical protein